MNRVGIACLALLTAGACEMEAPVGEEACGHFQDGPFEDFTATEGTADAPDISADHSAKRIATVVTDEDGNRGGHVRFTAASDGPVSFFMSHHFDMHAIAEGEDTLMPEKSVHDVDACEEAAMFHVFHLTAGDWTIRIGPTQEETVTVVWQTGDAAEGDTGQHDHDDHDQEEM